MNAALVTALFLVGANPARAVADDVIVVTAERRARALDETAGNAAALEVGVIERVGAQHPAELLNRLPGVNIHRGSGVESLPAIRSPVLSGGQGAGSFLVLEDGVPIRAPGFANINQAYETSLEFAERVEVTRGPGTALYGSNAVHGLINVITPDVAARDWSAEVEAGSFGRLRGKAFIGAEDALLGVAALHEDGWRDNAGLDEQKLLLGWDGAAAEWEMRGRFLFVNLNQETAGFVVGHEAYRNAAAARRNAEPEAFRDSKLARAHLTATRRLGAGWSAAVTPYARWIHTDLLLHFFPSRALEETDQIGGGVQTALYWDPQNTFSFIVGADADWTKGALRETQRLPTLCPGASPCPLSAYPQGVHYDYEVDARVAAVFAQARWRFAPRWTGVLGARGEVIRYDYDDESGGGLVGRFRRPNDRTDELETLTPKFGVIYAFDRGSAFLNAARGARPPQASDLYSLQVNQQPGEQEAEEINSLELGVRTRVGGGRIEVTAYQMDKERSAFRNASGFTVTDARTRHLGVEVAAEHPLTDALDVSGWATYAEHTYRFSEPAEQIVSGADVDTAPNWLWNIALAWRPSHSLSAELQWEHVGAYFTDAANAHSYDGHDLLNLRGEFAVFEELSLFGAIRNMTDAKYAERADFAFGSERYFPGEDRSFSLGLRVRASPGLPE